MATQDDQQPTDQVTDNNPPTTEIEQLQAELAQMTDTAKRALADLQNTQRRAEEARLTIYPQAQADLMLQFLPVLNAFHLAFQNIPADIINNEWVTGMQQVEKQFDDILAKIGLETLNPAGATFDPNQHEAMLEVDGEKGIVVQVLEKGYKLKDKVLKPAKVSVGRG